MRIVVALGGNALLERGEAPDSDIQESHVARAVDALRPLLHDHQLVITHGNGPQVGVLAIESASDPALSRPYPLDVLGAQTQGMIGCWLVQALDAASGRPAGPRPAWSAARSWRPTIPPSAIPPSSWGRPMITPPRCASPPRAAGRSAPTARPDAAWCRPPSRPRWSSWTSSSCSWTTA